MSNNPQNSKTTIIIVTVSVIGLIIATVRNAVISNWRQIFPEERVSSSNQISIPRPSDNISRADIARSENNRQKLQEMTQSENNIQSNEEIITSKQFERLENFVKQKQWVKAELELDLLQPKYLNCSQLSQINQIYSDGSNGHFGYKTQRTIWDSNDVNKDYRKFTESVGWKKEINHVYNINDPEMITNVDAQNQANAGHLPFNGWQVKGIIRNDFGDFMNQLKQCNI